jgi:hypothetical protein
MKTQADSKYLEKTFSEIQLLGITLLVSAFYFMYSFFSDGFYQHDEAAHFINMRTFWYQPEIILGNWAKPGYKLLYVIPALAGPMAVTLLNAMLSGFTAYFVYKIAKQLKLRLPFLAFFLMASQPLWIQLAFRNYSEIPTAFLVSVGLWCFFKQRYIGTALIVSYLTLLRQEFYIIGVLFGIFLLFNKEWKAIPFMLLFPLIIHIWGWQTTDDPLYLISSTLGTASTYKDAYPRLGFDHYFKMISTITGPLVIIGVLLGFKQIWNQRWTPGYVLAALSLIYFLIHCVFNWQSVKIGASTGGNLRYLTVIAPSLSLLAVYGIQQWLQAQKREIMDWIILGGYALITLFFLSYNHNNIAFTQEKSFVPIIFVLLFGAVLIWAPKKWVFPALGLIQIFYLGISVKPYQRSEEDKSVKQVVDWAQKQGLFNKPTMTQHTLFYYFTGKVQQELGPKNFNNIIQETVEEAPKGTIIFWDSHYSYRPKLRPTSLPHTYFLEKPDAFKALGQFLSKDQRFGVLVFEKL